MYCVVRDADFGVCANFTFDVLYHYQNCVHTTQRIVVVRILAHYAVWKTALFDSITEI